VYELFTGHGPFWVSPREVPDPVQNVMWCNHMILMGKVSFLPTVSAPARELVLQLLKQDSKARPLLNDLRSAAFFEGINWDNPSGTTAWERTGRVPTDTSTPSTTVGSFDPHDGFRSDASLSAGSNGDIGYIVRNFSSCFTTKAAFWACDQPASGGGHGSHENSRPKSFESRGSGTSASIGLGDDRMVWYHPSLRNFGYSGDQACEVCSYRQPPPIDVCGDGMAIDSSGGMDQDASPSVGSKRYRARCPTPGSATTATTYVNSSSEEARTCFTKIASTSDEDVDMAGGVALASMDESDGCHSICPDILIQRVVEKCPSSKFQEQQESVVWMRT
jgi:hypothetical protein